MIYSFIPFFFLLFKSTTVYATYDEGNSKEYWFLTTISYCKPANLAIWNIGSLKSNLPSVTDIRVYQNTNTDNQGYLAYNPQTKTIILTFRGSIAKSFQNWILQDINFIKTNYPQCANCQVHQGFYQAYKNLPDSAMISDLKALKNKYPQAKIVISGHSLGAAIANFAYVDACKALGKIDLLITYGSPRIGNSNYAKFIPTMNCGERIRVVHYKDIVPHMPLQMMGFQHAHSEIFYSNERSSSYTYCENSEDGNCADQFVAFSALTLNANDHLNYMDFAQNSLNC